MDTIWISNSVGRIALFDNQIGKQYVANYRGLKPLTGDLTSVCNFANVIRGGNKNTSTVKDKKQSLKNVP